MLYLVTYDIPDDLKRTKVYNLLQDYGTRVQFSVFECLIDEKLLKRMISRLRIFITDKDSIRIYSLCSTCSQKIQGLGSNIEVKEVKVYIL